MNPYLLKRINALTFFILLLFIFFSHQVSAEEEEAEAPPQYTISIVSPKNDETFQNSTQELPVTVEVTPPLREGDAIVILVNGEIATEPSQDTTINVPWQPRGEHTIQAKIIQKDGPGAESRVVTYFQHRTSASLPALPVNSSPRAPTAPTSSPANPGNISSPTTRGPIPRR